MELWATYQRIFYGSGILDFRYFPTLPMIFYLQLGPYSLYAMMKIFGLQDPLLFYHSTYVVESVFLKLPMILADAGAFLLLLRSGKTLPAVLYYLNPFMIYLSAGWGMYDSLMILCLVGGLLFLEKNNNRWASVAFAVSGLVKLFGFIPMALVMIDSLARRRFKDLAIQVAIAGSLVSLTSAPVLLQGGLPTFLSGFSRFAGTSSAQATGWNLVSALGGVRFPAVSLYVWAAYAAVPLVFVFQVRRGNSLFLSVLQASLIGAILLNIFSQAEPQWLSWPIPLALIYASVTKREGLSYYAYSFGTIATFLVMTLTQGSSYLLFGILGGNYLAPLEGFAGALPVYATVVVSSLLLLIGYIVAKPVKFRFEVLALVVIIYAQAYFWLSTVGIQNL